MVNLTSELVHRLTKESFHESGGFIPEHTVLIQRRFLAIILRILSIMKLVYTETKVLHAHELFQARDKKTLPNIEKDDEKVRKNSSPSFTRKLRNSLPFGNSDRRAEVSELPPRDQPKPHEGSDVEEILPFAFYQQLNSAYHSSKIKSDSGSNLSNFLSNILRAVRTFFQCIDFSLSSEFAEETLEYFNALFNATNGALPSEIIATVTCLLRALFQINDVGNMGNVGDVPSSGSVPDLIDKLYYTPLSLLQLSMTNSQMESESAVSHLSHERVESAWSKANKKRIESRSELKIYRQNYPVCSKIKIVVKNRKFSKTSKFC